MMENTFDKMERLINNRNNEKEDELKRKFEERLKKEDELYEWMAKLNVSVTPCYQSKIKRETPARVSK